MATVLEVTNGTTTLLPTTSWAAPNGLFGATADRNDSSAYGWSDSTATITLPSSGLADGYLFTWGFEFEDTSNGRHNPTARMVQASGTGTFASAATGGYNRDNSEDRSYVSGWSFVDNPSASSTYQFQWKRDTDTPTGGTVRSFIQAIPFYYADVGIYTSSTAGNYGGTTPTLMTGFSGTDGTNITITSNQVSVTGDNKRYLILGGAYQENVSGGSRTQRWYGLEIDGTFDDAAKGCMYYRNAANDTGGESFIRLIETATATRTIEMNGYRGNGVGAGQGGGDVDGTGTESNAAHALVVIELNDSAEVFSSTDSVGAQEFALTGPVDVDIASTGDIEFNDAASFTRATDIAVNCEVAMDVFAFANVSHAREASSIGSGSRWTVHGEFTIDGTEDTSVGFHGNYNRGNQSSADTHGSSCNQAGLFAVTANQDIGVSNQELSGTEGGNGDIETQPGWVGFGLINVDTLEATGSSLIDGASSLTFSETADLNGDGDLAGSSPLTFTDTATLMSQKGSWTDSDIAPWVLPIIRYQFAAAPQGAIDGASSLTFSELADLNGDGDLAGPATLTFSEAATLTADGDLAGTATLTFSELADLNGLGDLAGAGTLTFSEVAVLSADGDLLGTGTLTFGESATLTADGALVGPATLTFSETADLNADGDLAGTAGITFSLTGVLELGPISGATTITFGEAADLNGTGDLSGSTSITFTETADLNGYGVLAGPSSLTFGESATLTEGITLFGAGSLTFTTSGQLVQPTTGKQPAGVWRPINDLKDEEEVRLLAGIAANLKWGNFG
jgi:hypothetical protein